MSVTDIASFAYSLNGVAVNILPSAVVFFSSSINGGFDVQFTAGGVDTTNGITCSLASVCSLNVFDAQLFTGGPTAITIQSATATAVDFDYSALLLPGDFTNLAGTGSVGTFTVTQPRRSPQPSHCLR